MVWGEFGLGEFGGCDVRVASGRRADRVASGRLPTGDASRGGSDASRSSDVSEAPSLGPPPFGVCRRARFDCCQPRAMQRTHQQLQITLEMVRVGIRADIARRSAALRHESRTTRSNTHADYNARVLRHPYFPYRVIPHRAEHRSKRLQAATSTTDTAAEDVRRCVVRPLEALICRSTHPISPRASHRASAGAAHDAVVRCLGRNAPLCTVPAALRFGPVPSHMSAQMAR